MADEQNNGEQLTEEQKAAAQAEAKAREAVALPDGEGGREEEIAGDIDFGGMITDEDQIEVGGKKIKFAEAKKLIENAEKNKEILDAIEKDPTLKEKLIAKETAQQAKKGNEADAVQTSPEANILLQLQKREIVREYEKIKETYPLVELSDIAGALMNNPNASIDDVEPTAKRIQAYFDRKLSEKEKLRVEGKLKAQQTTFPAGGGTPPPPAAKGGEVDLNNLDSIKNALRGQEQK